MSVIKFTIASIHYLRDVFVASAVVGSKLPGKIWGWGWGMVKRVY